MKQLGVPYTDQQVESAGSDLEAQAAKIASELIEQGAPAQSDLANKEIIALIAYLQRLGTDIKGGTR
jgi:cytochrome c oxidase cbb3-type subunit I/II